MTTLYAQPYDISASGFYFDSAADYHAKAAKLINAHDQPVEEFEIQFIDGDTLDCELFTALGVHQGNFAAYLEAVADWSDDQKIRIIIAVGEAGYSFDLGRDDPAKFDIDLYEVDTLHDLAVQFVEDGLFGDIPATIENYLDYDAIARDLGMDYRTATVGRTRCEYRAFWPFIDALGVSLKFRTGGPATFCKLHYPRQGHSPFGCLMQFDLTLAALRGECLKCCGSHTKIFHASTEAFTVKPPTPSVLLH